MHINECQQKLQALPGPCERVVASLTLDPRFCLHCSFFITLWRSVSDATRPARHRPFTPSTHVRSLAVESRTERRIYSKTGSERPRLDLSPSIRAPKGGLFGLRRGAKDLQGTSAPCRLPAQRDSDAVGFLQGPSRWDGAEGSGPCLPTLTAPFDRQHLSPLTKNPCLTLF